MKKAFTISRPGTWLFLKSETSLWTVGFFKPDGAWEPESDYPSQSLAADRVHFLNGGSPAEDAHVQETIKAALREIIAAANRFPVLAGPMFRARTLLEELVRKGGAA